MNSHSNINRNDNTQTILRRSEFEGFFSILDNNSRDNKIVLVDSNT